MKIPFVSDWIPKKLRDIPKPVKVAMLSALVIGILCHIQAITQQMVNHDTVTTIGDDGMWLLTQGKWFFGYLATLRGSIATSGIETTLALLLLPVCAGLTTSVLRVKSSLHAALIGAMLVAFPSVFCSMLYLGEDTIFSALVLATLAVYVTTKYKRGFIGGIVLLTLSTGVYQAYIGYAAGLFVIVSLIDILENTKKPKEILLGGLKYIGVLLAAIVLYYVCLRILLTVQGVELSGYLGISSFADIRLGKTLKLIWDAYTAAVKFMLFDAYGTGQAVFVWIYRLVLLANIVLCGLIAVKTKLYKNILMLLLAVLLGVFALPLAVHAVAVLGQNIGTHWMMKYPFVLMFVVMIALLERLVSLHRDNEGTVKLKKHNAFSGLQWLIVALTAVLIFNWFILANQAYQKMRYVYEAVYAKSNRLVEAIYQDEDYTPGMPVIAVGDAPFEFMNDSKTMSGLDKFELFTGFDNARNVFTRSGIMFAFMRNYLGADFNDIDSAEIIAKHPEELQSMGVYPGKDSMRMINGVLVVKLGVINN